LARQHKSTKSCEILSGRPRLSFHKHHHAVRRNDDRRGRHKSVQASALGNNAAAIARYCGLT
jgi:hypothetical protein